MLLAFLDVAPLALARRTQPSLRAVLRDQSDVVLTGGEKNHDA